MSFDFPLKLHFRLIALAPRISVKDAKEKEILYVEQKIFALREAVKVYNNASDKKLLYTIQAEQIIDFGARYLIRTENKKDVGSIRQEGMRSIVQASYEIADASGSPVYKALQKNPWIGLADTLVSLIPFAELLTGFFFNPVYTIAEKENGEAIVTMKKKPSFFESEFEITLKDESLSEQRKELIVLALLMLVQLERQRS